MGATSSSFTHPPPYETRLSTALKTGRLRLCSSPECARAFASVSALSRLKGLDVSSCGLAGLPCEVGQLLKLQQLNARGNPKLKELPAEICWLKELRKVDCAGCVELRSCEALPRNVEYLDLSGCGFSGSVGHPELPLGRSLIFLSLENNKKITSLGEGFGFEALENLEELNLSNTAIRDVPKEIGCCKRLKVLKLENTNVESLPIELFTETQLSRLELKGTAMTKDVFLQLHGVDVFIKRRTERIDKEVAGGTYQPDTSVCGLD